MIWSPLFFLATCASFLSNLSPRQSGASPCLLETSSWWTIPKDFGSFKPRKRFCTLQQDFSLAFDSCNDHFWNSIRPILDLYAILLRVETNKFSLTFFVLLWVFPKCDVLLIFYKSTFSSQQKDCFIDFTFPKC
jgi:hypothetical protein